MELVRRYTDFQTLRQKHVLHRSEQPVIATSMIVKYQTIKPIKSFRSQVYYNILKQMRKVESV